MSKFSDVDIPKIPHLDKWVHGVVYAIFSFLLVYGWKRRRSTLTPSHCIYAILIAGCYGASMEVLQFFSKDRSFEWLDMAANLVGAVFGAVLFYVWKRNFC